MIDRYNITRVATSPNISTIISSDNKNLIVETGQKKKTLASIKRQ